MNTLLVLPNPFTVLDAAGLPCGFAFVDPTLPGVRPFQIVGGTLTKKVIPHPDIDKKKGKAADDVREAKVKVTGKVALRAVKVTNNDFHRAQVLCGDVVAVDKATAVLCGMKSDDFQEPAQVLCDAHALRVDEWKAGHGGEAPPFAELAFVQRGQGENLAIELVQPDAKGGFDAGNANEGVFVAVRLKSAPSVPPTTVAASAPKEPTAMPVSEEPVAPPETPAGRRTASRPA